MFVQIQISDELYQEYAARNPERPQKAIAETLQTFSKQDPKQAAIIFSGPELRELSRLLGHPISTAAELVEHVVRSERVSLGDGVEVLLNVGQRQRLKAQADFFKQDFKEFTKQQVAAGIVTTVGV